MKSIPIKSLDFDDDQEVNSQATTVPDKYFNPRPKNWFWCKNVI